MQRGHDNSGSTRSRRYPCSAKCVISPNFKHGCFEKVCASHLNVSPDLTFIQFASQLRASMVSSHIRTPTAANRSGWDSQHQSVALRDAKFSVIYPNTWATGYSEGPGRFPVGHCLKKMCFILLKLGQSSFMKQGWSCKMLPLLVPCLHRDSRWSPIVKGVMSSPTEKKKRDSDKNWILLELLNQTKLTMGK